MNDLILRNFSVLNDIYYPLQELSSIPSQIIHFSDNISVISNTFNHIVSTNRGVVDAVSSINPILPISIIKEISLTQDTLNSLYNSLNLIDWESINQSLTILQKLSNIPRFNIVYTEKEEFALNLYDQIDEIDDNEELKDIFTLDFLLSLTKGVGGLYQDFQKKSIFNYLL